MISRGRASNWKRTAGVIMALGLVAGACSSDSDDDADTTDTTDTETTDAETDTTDAETDTTDAETDDTVEVVQSEGGTLAAVQERGTLICGGNDTLPGFGIIDEAGDFSGFDIDFCRVVAAAVLGDADAVEFVPLTAEARFTAL